MWGIIGRILMAAACIGTSDAVLGQSVSDFQARTQRISASKSLPYRLFIPKNYQSAKAYPLMITLHGAGERGTDNAAQLVHDFSKRWAADSLQSKSPHFVVAPQCPPNNQWVDTDWGKGSYDQSQVPISDELQAVVAILDSLGREFNLDANRIYVSGLSMGGYGTWDLVARYPGRFAAAVAVCGAGDPRKAQSLAKLPLWAFHAEGDNVVPVAGSRDMVNALKSAGGEPKYKEYPAAQHVGHGSWVLAGHEPGLNTWLFAQARVTTVSLPQAAALAGLGGMAWEWRLRQGRFLRQGAQGSPVDGLGRQVSFP